MMLSWDVNNGVSILFKHIFFPTSFMCFLSRDLLINLITQRIFKENDF